MPNNDWFTQFVLLGNPVDILLYIPVYKDGMVHFRDVFRQIIKNGFDSTGEEYEPNERIQAKFLRKWKKPIKRSDIITDHADIYVAGRMVYDKLAKKVLNKKAIKPSKSPSHSVPMPEDSSCSDEISVFSESVASIPVNT